MNSPDQISSRWQEILKGAPIGSDEIRVADSGIKSEGGPVLLAIDEKGLRHLLVTVPGKGKIIEDRRSSGVHIRPHRLIDNGVNVSYIDVVCVKPHLNSLFDVIASEMLIRLASSCEPASSSLLTVLNRWRELLEQERLQSLSIEALGGLFGELYHLQKIIKISKEALDCWTGPFGARHDFRKGKTALEVKTTTCRAGFRLTISSIDQLEPPEGGSLYLGCLRIAPVPGGGITVPQLVQELLDSGVNKELLTAALAKVGYFQWNQELYLSSGFEISEQHIYRVDDHFPALTLASFKDHALPAGVLSVQYQIELSAQKPAALNLGETEAVYNTLATGAVV